MNVIAPELAITRTLAAEPLRRQQAERTGLVWLFDTKRRLFLAKGRDENSTLGELPAPAREAFAFLLCRALGLTTPNAAVIETESLRAREPGCLNRIHEGSLFGSEAPYREGSLFDYLPAAYSSTLFNRREMLSWLVFDLWVGNAEPAQAIFLRMRRGRFKALKISHSRCFSWREAGRDQQPASHLGFASLDTRHLGTARPVIDKITALARRKGALEGLAQAVPVEFGGCSVLRGVVVRELRKRSHDLHWLVGDATHL